MSQDLVNLLDLSSLVLPYVTGNVVFTAATDTIGKNAAFTGVVAGGTTNITISSAEDGDNDGVWGVVTATANAITVGAGSTVTGNADDDAAVILGTYLGLWMPVKYYSRIVGIVSSDQDVTVTTKWGTASTGGTYVSVTSAVTGGTPLSIASEILGPYVRFDIINNDTDTATLNFIMYAKSLS